MKTPRLITTYDSLPPATQIYAYCFLPYYKRWEWKWISKDLHGRWVYGERVVHPIHFYMVEDISDDNLSGFSEWVGSGREIQSIMEIS